MSIYSVYRFFVVVVLVVILLPMGAAGDESKFIPSLDLKESYNDNVVFSANDKLHSLITTVTPGLSFTKRTEMLDLGLSARADIARYHNEPTFNSESQYYNGKLGYTFSSIFNVKAEGGWSKTYGPERDLYTTGLVLSNSERERSTLGLSAMWTLSEKLALGADYAFQKDFYASGNESDINANQFGIGLYHTFNPSMKGRFNAGYEKIRFSAEDSNNYWSTIGCEYKYHELWSVVVDAGGRFSQTDYQDIVDKTSDDWGGVFKTALNYNGEKTNFSLSINYDLAPASGRNGPVQRTAFMFDMQKRLTYEFSGALSTGYFLNRATEQQFGINEVNEETFRISPSLRYNFTKDIMLSLDYDFTSTKYRATNTNADRNLIFLKFHFQFPIVK